MKYENPCNVILSLFPGELENNSEEKNYCRKRLINNYTGCPDYFPLLYKKRGGPTDKTAS